MNEDPTRLMDYGDEPPRRRRPPQKPKGNLRLVVAIMGAVIFGLLIALLVSCGGGETKTVTQTTEITREIPSKSSEEKSTEGEEEAEETEESAEEQELREIEEAEAAEAGTGGVEEAEPTQEELELREIEEAEAAEGPTLEEPEGGGVGTE